MIKVKRYSVGDLRTNCYILHNTDENIYAIVDPGGESSKLEETIKKIGSVKYIFLTHGHFDHISEAEKYKNITGAKIVIGKDEEKFLSDNTLNLSSKYSKNSIIPFGADILVNDGDEIDFGSKKIKVMFTPGHTSGSVCYLVGDVMFSGDTLFRGEIGRTDLKSGNLEQMRVSLKKLYELDDEYVVYPGHGLFTFLSKEKLKYTGLI
ncbi:MAG: MBL fold metallo-hydrolase [Clostridia bacterium]|nr:MBL fold metallo-hydrolase [Clostridia bacterium]